MHSCLYEGTVVHHRLTPVEHRFRYTLQYAYVDLDELDGLQRRGLLGRSRWSSAALRPEDHFDGQVPLAGAVRRLVAQRTGAAAEGPIRMLTLLRWFGLYFSPLNVYFCFDEDRPGADVTAVVAEVSNTPWRERHHYVLDAAASTAHARSGASASHRFQFDKQFHVSPFLDMEQSYRMTISPPRENLTMAIGMERRSQRLLNVSMDLGRRPLTRGEMLRSALRYPATPLRILTQIYYQAWRLWRKQCPLYPHPAKHSPATTPAA
ncbi:MAG: DUF1365 domain-containing protein [Pirellulaceae bacterium]